MKENQDTTSIEGQVNAAIQYHKEHDGLYTELLTDGFHTFGELYEHRTTLFIALCKQFLRHAPVFVHDIWRSKLHSDGTMFEGWFVIGINAEAGKQITYHLPISKWDEVGFIREIEKAPEWDGHTAQDVIERLKKI